MAKPRAKIDLDILTEVGEGSRTSQVTLARRVGVAVGLVNALLRRLIRNGFIKFKEAPAKRYIYYLTPSGFAEKSRLLADYIDVSLRFFREARTDYLVLFEDASRQGIRRVVLVGAGELAEIAVVAAWQAEVELVGVVDPALNRSRFAGQQVWRSLDELAEFDAAVLTDGRAAQEIFDRLAATLPEGRVLSPAFLRIVRPHTPAAAVGEAR